MALFSTGRKQLLSTAVLAGVRDVWARVLLVCFQLVKGLLQSTLAATLKANK